MNSSLRHRSAIALPLLIAPLLLTACSSPAASGGGSAAESSAKTRASEIAGATGQSAPAAQTGPVTTGDQLCAVVPAAAAAAAAAALGTSPAVSRAEGDSYLNGEPMCGYSDSGPLKKVDGISVPSIGVTVVWGPVSQDPYDTTTMFGTGAITPVPGVGQRAAVRDSGFEALIGDHTLQMVSAGATDLTHDQMVALAKAFAAKL